MENNINWFRHALYGELTRPKLLTRDLGVYPLHAYRGSIKIVCNRFDDRFHLTLDRVVIAVK